MPTGGGNVCQPSSARAWSLAIRPPGATASANERAKRSERAQSIAASPPAPSEIDRHRFLLGRMLERAGRYAEARDAFIAVSPASLLAPYAELGAARMELTLGFADKALAHLGRAGEELPASAGRRRLLADAAFKSGARDIALREYRQLLEAASGDREPLFEGAARQAACRQVGGPLGEFQS